FFSSIDYLHVCSGIFFFQAEDGIRDRNVTGVQTCALPILKKAIISNAKTASKTPIGSTIIPSHFNIFAGRVFNFDWRKSGIITVGPVTMNKPPITNATAQDSPAI